MDNRIVIEPTSKIREIARNSLTGYWKEMLVGMLIYFLLTEAAPTVINYFFTYEYQREFLDGMMMEYQLPYGLGLYTLVLSGPLMIGLYYFILAFFRRREVVYGNIFEGFEVFGKSLVLYLLYTVKIFLWSLLLFIPGIIASYSYSQAFILRIDHPDWSAGQCLRESRRIMNGNKATLFCLQLSFIGWMLLSALPVMVGELFTSVLGMEGLAYHLVILLFTVPSVAVSLYFYVAEVAFYELLTGNLVVADEPDQSYDYM